MTTGKQSAETGGYISDVAYVTEFYGDHAPVHINLTAAANGFRPRPLDQGFTWCDYGCGNGVTATGLAGCYPQGKFYGVDFLAAHIRMAETLALRAGLENTVFLEKSFSALAPGDLPPLDFAVMHGVLSWIDEPTRAALLDDAARRLKPGGLLLTGTNAMPGWAAKMPMRNMVYSLTPPGTGSMERARIGLAWLKSLKGAEAKFFRDHPAMAEAVEELERLDPRYMAHEYFNEHLRAFYFAELRAMMEARGLKFAGSARLFLNMVDLAVPPALRDDLRGAKSRAELEAKRDFIRNETFRRDVWIKGDGIATEDEWLAVYQDMIFGTVDPLHKIDKKVAFGDVQLSYDSEPLRTLLARVAGGASRLSVLARQKEFASLPPWTMMEALRLLTAGGQVFAFAEETQTAKVSRETTLSIPAINRALIRELALACPRVALAAVHAGTGIDLRNTDAFLLVARCDHGYDGAVAAAMQAMSSDRGTMIVSGKALSPAEMQRLLATRLAELHDGILDKLVEIGVIAIEN